MRDPVVVAADLGFAKKGRNFAASLRVPIAFIEKRRTGKNDEPEALTLIGDVAGRDVIVVDDEVDTAGSICQAVNLVKKSGALDVYVTFVHPIFSDPAVERLSQAPIKEMITTDSIPITPEHRARLGGMLTVLSTASLIGEVILRAHEGRSVGEMFDE